MRRVQSIAVLVLLGSACSSEPSPAEGGGGAAGTAGVSSQGGTTAAGAPAGAGGPSGNGGSLSNGGTANTSGTAGAKADAGQASTAGSAGQGAGGSSAGTGGGGSGSGGGGGGGAMTSKGCGQAPTLKNGTITINTSRKYILRLPDGYDNKHPYRLVFAFAESGSSASSVATRNYFTLATLDGKNTIFAAPDAADGKGTWSKTDLELTDAILKQLEEDLCVDTSRIFATGFSFGGAMSLALACQRADVFRGVAFFSGSDLTGSCTTPPTKPIAYYASSATGDSGTGTPAATSGRAKQAQFAALNGCTAEPDAITFPAAGQPHKCTNYKGCSAGHPTEFCVFEGDHGWEPKDPGQQMSWDAPEAWKFITQF